MQALDDEIERDAVVDRLNGRWSKSLTLMSAPGGYGKTRALAQAVRSNEANPIGVEFYLRCRPSHADPMRFLSAVLEALGVTADRAADPEALAERVVDELALRSPSQVALIVDDVHLLATNPIVVGLLSSIIRDLATNSHVVLVGRSIPEMPLARLQADDSILEIGQDDLTFSEDELHQLAQRHGVDVTLLGELAGWPALVRLAVVAGKSGTQNYLMQEIIDDLPAAVVQGLSVAVMAGGADEELLTRCGVELSAEELSDRVPMLDFLPTGYVQPHDLWSELSQALVGDTDLGDLVSTIAEWHGDAGRFDEAIILATSHGADDVARGSLMDALGTTDVSLRASTTGHWLELFGGAESVGDDDPDLLLLRGWHGRLAHGPGHGDEDVSAAVDLFHARGDVRGEAYASVENAFRGYLAGDVDRIADSVRRGPRLVAAGMDFLLSLGALTNAVVADINGDFAKGLEFSMRAISPDTRPEFVELVLRHRATLQFLVGEAEAAIATTQELEDFAPTPLNRTTNLVARFAAGDIDDLVEQWDQLRYLETGNKRDDFIQGVKSVFIDACLGFEPQLEHVRNVTWERPRERFQAALCEWCAGLLAGDEEAANHELARQVDELGLDDPMVRGDLSRFILSAYIAVPDAREFLEEITESDGFGPYQVRQIRLARILLGLRTNASIDWSGYVNPKQTISSMSLPWSVEIACGLVLHDEERGLELADALFTYTGGRAHRWLRGLAEGDASVAAGARKLLSLLPVPPEHTTALRTSGGVVVERRGATTQIRRARVRQLLLILAIRGSLRRDVAMELLWPDKDVTKARNNLRITLSHLRADLEPDRRSGEPSYHLRQRGDEIVLHRSDSLRIDISELQDGLAIAETKARNGDRSGELEALTHVASQWQPPHFDDLIDIAEVRPEVERLRAQLVDCTAEVAAAMVSNGEWHAAEQLARKLLLHDRYDERGHATLIACHLGIGNLSQTHRAIDECLNTLGEIGVSPAATTRMLMRRAQWPDQGLRAV